MDFITSLLASNDFIMILVVIDKLSKYVHFSALKIDYANKLVAKVFMKIVVRLHGILNIIIYDRDRVCTSQF